MLLSIPLIYSADVKRERKRKFSHLSCLKNVDLHIQDTDTVNHVLSGEDGLEIFHDGSRLMMTSSAILSEYDFLYQYANTHPTPSNGQIFRLYAL